MRIAVTGRTGQLARSLAERAAQHPALDLFYLARPEVDLREPGSLAQAIVEHRPDVVVNASAYTAVDQAEDEPELAQRINGEAAGEAAAAARDVGAAIIQISTDYVFDGRGRVPYRETDPVRPLGVYGRTKLSGEAQVREANPRHVIVRTAWVFSPFGRNFVKSMIAAAGTRDQLTVVDDQLGTPTSALDLADAVLLLLRRWNGGEQIGLGETYHVAGCGITSWCGIAEEVMRQCRNAGLPAAHVKPIRTEDWTTRAVRPSYSALDSSKFEADSGFQMPAWQEAVAATVAALVRARSVAAQ